MFKHVNRDGKKDADFVKQIHAEAREKVLKKTNQYAKHANKGCVKLVFDPGDWVWLHMREERFSVQRRSKLLPRGDGPFQVLESINDNDYKIDLPGKYGVSTTFNVSNLSPFDVGHDLRTNLFQERGNDENIEARPHKEHGGLGRDPLALPSGPITRARARRFKDAVNGLICSTLDEVQFKGPKMGLIEDRSLINNIQVMEDVDGLDLDVGLLDKG